MWRTNRSKIETSIIVLELLGIQKIKKFYDYLIAVLSFTLTSLKKNAGSLDEPTNQAYDDAARRHRRLEQTNRCEMSWSYNVGKNTT